MRSLPNIATHILFQKNKSNPSFRAKSIQEALTILKDSNS